MSVKSGYLATGIITELSKADIRELQRAADNEAIAILVKKDVDKAENLVVRDGFPLLDLAFATEEWIEDFGTRVPAIAANAWGPIDAGMPIQVPADRRSHVYYGVKNLNALPQTTMVQFNLGAVAGTPTQIKDQWDIEKLYTTLEQEGYTEHPIIYDPAEFYTVRQYINRSANDHIVYMLRVAEKKGETFMAVSKK